MLAISRFEVHDAEAGDAAPVRAAHEVLRALAARPGFVRGRLAEGFEGAGWVLLTEWTDLGSYRRGLSGYEVKLAFAGLMPAMVSEAGAYEVVADVGTATPQADAAE